MLSRRGLLFAGAAWPATAAWAGLPEVVAAARASVLPIGRFDPLGSPRFSFRGSAFVVGDGRQVVTCDHVVPPGELPAWVLQRPLPGGGSEWRRLTMTTRDPEHDLALLALEGEPLPALPLAPDDAPREGQEVLVLGFPIGGLLGFQPVTHRGIISSIAPLALPAANAAQLRDSSIAALRRASFDILQLDATAYPGNSGGPLLDAVSGQVLGVLNMVLARGGREAALSAPTGISYAIPGRWVRALMAVR
jgi:S1-C subfamily serine protease